MTEKAIILDVKDNIVKLTPMPNDGCASCGGECNTKHTIFTVENIRGLNLKAGTLVEIEVSRKTKFLQGFITLFLPFLMAVLGFFSGRLISPVWEAVFPISFFALTCTVVFFISRKKKLPGQIEIIGLA